MGETAAAASPPPPIVLPGRGVSSLFIDGVLQKYCSDYVGTYASDNIPLARLSKLDRYSLVCNLSPAHLPGSHFVAFTVDERRIVLTDPLILPTRFIGEGIRKFLRSAATTLAKKKKKIKRRRIVLKPSRQIQSSGSLFCGLFAMVYVMHFDSGVRGKPNKLDFKSVRRPDRDDEDDDGRDNEELCIKYLMQMISACAAVAEH